VLRAFGLPADYLESVLFLSGGKLYKNSEAVLQLARELPFPFPLAYPLIFIPAIVRDTIYRFIAKHRYQWFGKQETCRLPTAEERARFL
jgi:predicted DCC family thiol-disulfide oxidoreductase YuxK